MPDLEKEKAGTEEPTSEFAKFAQEFHDAKFQRTRPEDKDAKEKVTLADDEKPEPKQPEPKTEPAKDDVVKEEPKRDAAAEVTDPQVKLYTVPDHEMYGALRGQKVTAAQLEEAGLIGKVITRDHQEMHNTKLYNELKRDFEDKLAAALKEVNAPKPEPPPKIDPKTFADDVERTYVPVLKKLAESGSIEPDFVEAYPRFAAQTAHQIETMRLVGAGLVKAVGELKQWADGQQATTTRSSSRDYLENAMVGLAESDELYATLKDPAERKAFVDWMSDKDNPQPWKKLDIFNELTKQNVLQGAYAAYRTATRHLRVDKPAVSTDKTREKAALAAPGGGNARTTKPNETPNEFESLKREFLESRARAFGR